MQIHFSSASSSKILQGVTGVVMQIAFLWILFSGITLIHNFVRLAVPISSTKTGVLLVLLTFFLVFLCTHGRFYGDSRFLRYVIVVVGLYAVFLLLEGFLAIIADAGIKRALTTLLNIGAFILLLILMFLWSGGGENPTKGLQFILRPYVYACLYIAGTGIIAWNLVFFQAVDLKKWQLPREITPAAKTVYMPWYLSQVSGEKEESFRVFGYEVIRLAGFSKEPAQAALFVTPALFMTPFLFKGLHKTKRRRFAMAVLIFFIFVIASVANWILLALLLPLLFFRYRSKVIFMVMIAVTIAGTIFLSKDVRERYGIEQYERNIVRHKIQARDTDEFVDRYKRYFVPHAELGVGIFGTLEQEQSRTLHPRSLLSVFFEHMLYVAMGITGLILVIRSKNGALFGFSLLYLLGHTQKDPVHTLEFPFYVFILFCAAIGFVLDFEMSRIEYAPKGDS
ncbi:MAG: hypothetical protein Q7S48_03200 [bacterium]|nr:hypothetical protein [bacterium]